MIKKRLFTRICNILIGISLFTIPLMKTTAQTAKYTGLEPGTFMQRWLLLGPIPVFKEESEDRDFNANKAAFEQEPLPAQEYTLIKTGRSVEISGKTYVWEYLNSDDNIVDFDKQYKGADFATAYACADITLANPEKVLLGIGSDDGIKIWLNG